MIDDASWTIATIFSGVGQFVENYSHVIEALAGLAVAILTLVLARIARRANEHFRVTERAYTKMSHFPPGVAFVRNMGAWHIVLAVRIKNFGHTPAHVTDVFVDRVITDADQGLPPIPNYQLLEGRETSAAFLVAEDEFVHRVDLGITLQQYQEIQDGTADLYIIGYVDYRDKFGDRHRGSYARAYDLGIDDVRQYPGDDPAVYDTRNNLTIVSAPRYNDDRVRMRGEGNDWEVDGQ